MGEARHTATREGRGTSWDSPLDCREGTERERGRSETEDVTWGPRDSQVLPKYEKIKGVVLKGKEA